MERSRALEFCDKNEFAKWVVETASTAKVMLSRSTSSLCREELLKFAGRWPMVQLRKLATKHQNSMGVQYTNEDVKDDISTLRTQLASITNSLFAVTSLSKPTKRHNAVVTLRAFIEELQQNDTLWSKIESPTKFTLGLPLRKKPEMRQLMNLLGQEFKSIWSDAVERVFMLMKGELGDTAITQGSAALNKAYAQARDDIISKEFQALLRQWSCKKAERCLTLTPVDQNGSVMCHIEEVVKRSTGLEAMRARQTSAARDRMEQECALRRIMMMRSERQRVRDLDARFYYPSVSDRSLSSSERSVEDDSY